MSTLEIILLILALLLLFVGPLVGYFLRVKQHEKSLRHSKEEAENIIEEGKKEAENAKKEAILEARQEIFNQRKDFERDVKERRQVVVDLETKISKREEMLNNRSANLDRREEHLATKEIKLDERKFEVEELNSKAEELVRLQEQKLIEISNISIEEAKDIIMERVKADMEVEVAAYIKEAEENAKNEADTKAKMYLTLAIQKYASETTTERTVSVVDLPSEEMKGRIIGREGRNIRTFEALTGVDLIIDDTPEAVVLSGFDPVRREVAKRTLASLVEDGRIHPGRIEEVVARSQAEVETFIRKTGEDAVFETSVGKMHPDLVKLLGKLQFRTSYGQNVLRH